MKSESLALTLPSTCLNRRQFVAGCAAAAASIWLGLPASGQPARRKMTINLSGGSIGVNANQLEAIALAHRHGFESVDADPRYLASLSDVQMQELQADMKKKSVLFGHAGLPADFRRDEEKFSQDLKALPRLAAALQRAGVHRVTTWLTPGSDGLTYLQNFKQHAQRLRAAAAVLRDHGLSLGLEYVGTKTLRDRFRFAFVHTMAETKELITEIGTGNVGFVLDSWHWWTAGEKAADIRALQNRDVVSVDLNDAPAGIPVDKQMDGRRELPCATGVIPVAEFLQALNGIGYDGPVRAEPFNAALNELPNDEACAATVAAMRKAFELIG